ncbi:MAG: hypothetical protein ACYC3F_16770 [Gemmatimonadaceae bacterium]
MIAKQDAAVADALSRGLCAHASLCAGIVCLLPPHHDGPHASRDWWWGTEEPT